MHPLVSPFYSVLTGAAAIAAHLPQPGTGKVARAFRARRAACAHLEAWAHTQRDPSRPLVWVHAPSVGEGLQAKPVIERIRARHPDWQIAYTFFSPSAERFAAALGADVVGYLPFDTADAADRLLAALRPSALVFAKLDLWPRLAERAHAAGVPLGMISATLSPRSGRRGWMARAFLGDAYAALEAVGTIDVEDGARLAALGVRADRLTVTGDTRYDQVAARRDTVDRTSGVLATLASPRPTLVAGSTWPADDAVLCRAWEALLHAVPAARLIIAPHEPTRHHLEAVLAWASLAGLDCLPLGSATADTDVVLVDRVGVLGDLYALGTMAYVGGGFHGAGLHSVLEPASYGMPVLFGPRHSGSRDAGLLLAAGAGVAVRDVHSCTEALRILCDEPHTVRRAGEAARAVVEGGRGAADAAAALVERLVESKATRPG